MEPYVMSQFSGHNILGVLTMVVCIVSGVLRLPMAKFIDEFGRAFGFLMAAGLSILGLIIQAAARSLFTTIVAQVIFGIGWNLLDYVLSIVLADMTSLKNRGTTSGSFTCAICTLQSRSKIPGVKKYPKILRPRKTKHQILLHSRWGLC